MRRRKTPRTVGSTLNVPWRCQKQRARGLYLALGTREPAAEPVQLINITHRALPSDRSLKTSQELLLSSLCKHKLICGLFALVQLKKGQKASADGMYAGQKSTLNSII